MKARAIVPLIVSALVASETVQLVIPEVPPSGTPVLDGPLQGYSIEMADFGDFTGNSSSPNQLSLRMLKNLQDLAGSSPPIRIGGTTANHATYVSNQKEAIIPYYAVAGADQPANITWGPEYLNYFKIFPKGTQYTVGLTFDLGKSGEDNTVAEAKAFVDRLGDSLYAMEVGNEFDSIPVGRNRTTWNIRQYVSEWLDRTATVSTRVFGVPSKPIFQGGVFVLPGSIIPDRSWTISSALDLGIASTGQPKTMCIHQYSGAACSPVKPSLLGSILNRTQLWEQMAYHKVSADATIARGLKYVIGETNSIACQGLAGVSDVFAASLWSIDYAMHAASVGVSKMFWHMGTGYRYAAWQAIQNGTIAPGPRPLYYGNWFIATALAGGNKQVIPVLNTTSLAGYAIYGGSRPHQRARLESLIVVNFDVYNATATPGAARKSIDIALPALCAKGKVSVQRLTGPGIEAKEGMALAGQSVALDGSIAGKKAIEYVKNGVVTVQASEAVLISL